MAGVPLVGEARSPLPYVKQDVRFGFTAVCVRCLSAIFGAIIVKYLVNDTVAFIGGINIGDET